MKVQRLAMLAVVLLSCRENAKPPTDGPPPPPPIEATPPTVATISKPPPPAPVSGSRSVLAERTNNNDSWDKMIVAGGRLWALTTLNSWKAGPMYVPAARLWSVPITGGELTRHLEIEGLASLAADDTSLYVAVNRDLSAMGTSRAKAPTGRIFRLPLSGGAPVDLAKAIEPGNLALDGDTLWFDTRRMPKDGSKSPTLSGVKGALTFAFDDEHVYFTTAKGPESKTGRVLRMPKKGGPTTVIATGLPDEPGGLAVDASHVYVAAVTWTNEATERAGVVARVPKEGGELEILAKDQPALRHVWLGGDHLYVRSGRPGRPGTVLRMPKTGGAVEQFVTDGTLVIATMDDTSLYFSSDGTFKTNPIERLTPPILVRVVR